MGSTPQLVATPQKKELVTNAILVVVGLNAQSFSGNQNPSTIYRQMVSASPSVFPLYRELEEKDTAIASALETRRLLVLAREAKVQAANSDDGRARELAEDVASFLDAIPQFNFALWEMLDAPAYGFAVAEIFWNVVDGRVRVTKLVGRPQEIFRFGLITQPQAGELLLATNAGGEGQPVDPFKFLVSSYRPRHGDRRGMPLLRRLFWPSWIKRNALRLDLQFLEKGTGTVVVKYQPGQDDAEQKQALAAAEAIANELAAAVPQSFELMADALQTTRTREGKDYQQIIDYLDAEMTRIVHGQTLATRGSEQQRGTMALGNVHQQILFQFVKSDAADVEFVINEQLVTPYLLFQHGPQALDRAVRPWWTIDKDPPKDVAQAADMLIKAQALKMQITQTFAHEKLQIPLPEGDDPVLPPPADPFGGGASVGPLPPPEEGE